jgi:hypothetical protein
MLASISASISIAFLAISNSSFWDFSAAFGGEESVVVLVSVQAR